MPDDQSLFSVTIEQLDLRGRALLAIDDDLSAHPPTADEVTIAEALALALSEVLSTTPALATAWEGGEPFSRNLTVRTHAGDIDVTLAAPYENTSELPLRDALTDLDDLRDEDGEIDPGVRRELEDEIVRHFAASEESQALPEIRTVTPTKHWTHARHPYLAGNVGSTRFDVAALGLTPLALHEQDEWAPDQEYRREQGEPIDAWAMPLIARGKRPMFEMDQIVPGADPEDFDSDPISEAAERGAAGDVRGAYDISTNLLARVLSFLDAHAHVGNLELDRRPRQALLHYEMGTAIGRLSPGRLHRRAPVGPRRRRPFLRCLHGAGLCAWRLDDLRARGRSSMTRRSDPYSWTGVRLPERDLAETLFEFASPLLAKLGEAPSIDEERANARARALVLERERARLHALGAPTAQGAERAEEAPARPAGHEKTPPRSIC